MLRVMFGHFYQLDTTDYIEMDKSLFSWLGDLVEERVIQQVNRSPYAGICLGIRG